MAVLLGLVAVTIIVSLGMASLLYLFFSIVE